MIRIEFNAAAVLRRLDHARATLTDMTPVYRDIGESLVKATRARFPAGTAPDGARWRAKSPATIARYLRRGDALRGPGSACRPTMSVPSSRSSTSIWRKTSGLPKIER